jgi:hypothetical protein
MTARGVAAIHDDADDAAGNQEALRIRQLRPHRTVSVSAVDLDVEEIGDARMLDRWCRPAA